MTYPGLVSTSDVCKVNPELLTIELKIFTKVRNKRTTPPTSKYESSDWTTKHPFSLGVVFL